MKRVVGFLLSLTLLTYLFFVFSKTQEMKSLSYVIIEGTFLVKLGSLSFIESKEGLLVAY